MAETAKTTKKPQTMEELLANSQNALVVPKKGSTVTGLVTGKTRKNLLIDIGAKTEGVVTEKEYEVAVEYIDQLKEGDKVEAIVLSAENDKGQVLLSLKQAALDAKWDFFTQALKNNDVLEAKGIEINKGGLIVTVNGVRGFVPSSQFGKQFMGNINRLKGETGKVKAIEVDREKNRLIFSERHVSEEKELAQRAQALESVKIGEAYEGVVSGAMHFGLFVTVEVPVEGSDSVGHVEGLVHISEISWEKVNNPKDYNKVGDRVKVRVLGVDEHTGKLNLSMKQLTDDPWKEIAERYNVGTTFTGVVSRIEPFGVFVHVEAGVDGLIHSSKLDQNVQLKKDEEVTVTVESVDPDQRRMSLSMVLTEVPVGYK
jgi:ribosomal protein S1